MYLPNIQSWLDDLTRRRIILILIFLGLLAYANAVNHPFVHDDIVFIQQNPYIADLDLKNFFFQTSVPDREFSLVNQYYRPLLELTNRILYKIFRFNPHGFHFFNILLHILNSYCVFILFSIITDNKKKLSLAAAVIYLLHPVQSEAVACISGISNLVFTFLCLLSFYWYLRATQRNGQQANLIMYGFSLIIFFLALLAKEQAIVLPFLIIAYELCCAQSFIKVSIRKIWYCAGYIFVLVGYFILRKVLFGFAVTPTFTGKQEYWLILLAIPRSLLTYITLIFFPHDLHYYRSQDILLPYWGPIILLSLILIIVIYMIIRIPNPYKRWMSFGLAWFAISQLPTLNIIPLINEYSLILTSEHFLYLPIFGVILFIAGVCYYLIERIRREWKFSLCFIIFSIVSIIFLGMTVKQNTYWRGEIPLFERTLQFQKNFGRVHLQLAKSYAKAGRFDESVSEGYKALAILQGYVQKVNNKEVIAFYEGFIKQIYYHLGFCYSVLGEYQNALENYHEALILDPDNALFHFALGIDYVNVGDIPNATEHFKKTVELDVHNLMAMNYLALCYQETGQFAEAEHYLRIIAEKDNQSISAKQNLENFLKINN